jgi:hypothetical protein
MIKVNVAENLTEFVQPIAVASTSLIVMAFVLGALLAAEIVIVLAAYLKN